MSKINTTTTIHCQAEGCDATVTPVDVFKKTGYLKSPPDWEESTFDFKHIDYRCPEHWKYRTR